MTGRRKLVALLVASCIAGYTWLKQDFPRTDRLLIHNGTVITLEPDQLVAEAVLVERGRIVRIGLSSLLASDGDAQKHTAAFLFEQVALPLEAP